MKNFRHVTVENNTVNLRVTSNQNVGIPISAMPFILFLSFLGY